MICIEGKSARIALPTFCNVPVRALQAWSALKFVQQQVEAAQLDKKTFSLKDRVDLDLIQHTANNAYYQFCKPSDTVRCTARQKSCR